MRRFLIFAAFLLASVSAKAQTTNVTATVNDPNDAPYINCKGSVSFVPSPTATTQPTINGSTFQTVFPISQCDSTGSFSMTLVDNNQVSDGHFGQVSQWKFSISSADTCFAGNKVSFTTNITITGASQNISAALKAAAATLPSCGGGGGGLAPTLQTNGITNPNQTVLNLKQGANVTLASDALGGVSVNSASASSAPPAQGQTTGPDVFIVGPQHFCGIAPYADITCFGATAGGFTGIRDAATCATGSTAITMAHSFFTTNGSGLTIYGCGPTETMGAPSIIHGPSPIMAIAGTSPYGTYIDGFTFPATPPAGSSTYKYAVVARDLYGGLSPASTPITITTGPAALGLTSLTVTNLSLSGTTITVTTTGTQALAVGAEVHISGSTNSYFSGWFNVSTVNNAGNSFTVARTGVDAGILGAITATGGMVSYYTGIFLQATVSGTDPAAFYICAQRPGDGAMHVIGKTGPNDQSGSIYPDAWFYDYGPVLQGNNSFPTDYITDAICTSATSLNDPLTTTIVSGGGTPNLVVANAASQNASGVTAVYDDAPAILAAANSCSYNSPGFTGCSVYLPPVPASGGRLGYVVKSYLKLPSGITIKQAGPLFLDETLELQSPFTWEGDWISGPTGQFAMFTGSQVVIGKANPGVFTRGANSSLTHNIALLSNGTNGGVLWVTDDPYNQTWSSVSFDTNGDGAGDYCGVGMLVRSTTTGGNPIHMDHVSFSGGPNQVTDSSWCPLLHFPGNDAFGTGASVAANWFVDIQNIFLNKRGIQQDTYGGPGSRWNVAWAYRQGGITPMFTFENGTGGVNQYFDLAHSLQDSETNATVALLNGNSSNWAAFIHFTHVFLGSSEPGGPPPAVTGLAPFMLDDFEGGYKSLDKNTTATDQLGLHANLIQPYPSTFAVLPICNAASEGDHATVTDSMTAVWGATITGGGANIVQAFCDAANWTVSGK